VREVIREIVAQPHMIAFPFFEGSKSMSSKTGESDDAVCVILLIQLDTSISLLEMMLISIFGDRKRSEIVKMSIQDDMPSFCRHGPMDRAWEVLLPLVTRLQSRFKSGETNGCNFLIPSFHVQGKRAQFNVGLLTIDLEQTT
jgi:hypothetical protein